VAVDERTVAHVGGRSVARRGPSHRGPSPAEADTAAHTCAPTQEPECITVEPSLITRLSCGCLPGTGPDEVGGQAERRDTPRSIDRIVRDTLQRLRAEGAGLRNARLRAEVQRLSLTDPLTGLRNRAYLELAFVDEFERSKHYGRPLSVLMLDIDRFEDYDDAVGHPAGAVALVEVANAARSVARDADVFARYGGEEGVMVMAETDRGERYRLAEGIGRTVRELDGPQRQLSVSIGVASPSPSATNGETAHCLLERADRVLHQAKRRGRARVCMARAVDAHAPRPGDLWLRHRPRRSDAHAAVHDHR